MDLKLAIDRGLKAVSGPAYQKLKLKFHIYKNEVWKVARAKYCVDNTRVLGCTKAESKPDVYLVAGINNTTDIDLNHPHGKSKSVANLMLHEAAHKLHHSLLYLTEFSKIGQMLLKSRFTKEWAAAYNPVNEKQCEYLPIIARTQWKDTSNLPRCGFVAAYAASNYLDKLLVVRFQEDIASMTELLYFDSGIRKRGDFPNDPRYKQKGALLNKYGFLQ